MGRIGKTCLAGMNSIYERFPVLEVRSHRDWEEDACVWHMRGCKCRQEAAFAAVEC